MYNLDQLVSKLEEFAPLSLSDEMIKKGCYDNSGIIIRTHDNVKKVLFSLDLTEKAVNRAKRLGCDTIVTHHPAIYSPISQLDVTSEKTKAVTLATKYGFNVVSFHLNLDVARGGIDDCLAEALDATDVDIIDKIDKENGYGRAFSVQPLTLGELAKKIKNRFSTKRLLVYGNLKKEIKSVATFCGAGGTEAVKAVSEKQGLDVVISSDFKHNVLVELVESGVSVIVIPHYSSENLGFKRFYERVIAQTEINAHYFEDERFM